MCPAVVAPHRHSIEAGIDFARHLLQRAADERQHLAGRFDFKRERATEFVRRSLDARLSLWVKARADRLCGLRRGAHRGALSFGTAAVAGPDRQSHPVRRA